ncbi:hypothetical protein [Halorubrum sp. DTA46]|uniref:hypothetical protein n=1 Tax=Halorubrum sp. DTA46 TaxID=3402162 RepID=UPI003AAFDA99
MGQDARETGADGITDWDEPTETALSVHDGSEEPSAPVSSDVVHVVRDADGDTRTVAGYDPNVVLENALAWAFDRDYAGYDPYDGLNSPLLSAVSRHWLLRLLSIHGVRAFPVNLRPYLGVPEERNPKGIGLFASAYLNHYERTGSDAALEAAERLLDWLVENRSPAFERSSWGYNFDWQNSTKFFLPANHPCGVVTVFCARPFLRHHELTGSERSLELARDATAFLVEDIGTESVNGHDVLTYTPYDSYVAVNANALAADLLWRVGTEVDDDALVERARDLFEFVVDAQTDDGGWRYSVPASDSHLGYDNFHTGFVLESLSEYARDQAADHPAREAYERGMEFHRENHFEADGAPRFEDDQSRPYDVHAAAQALITFTQRGDPDDAALARTVLAWTLDWLYDPEGYFYRRVGRMGVDETPYIRWSQAWMCLALSEYVNDRHTDHGPT